VIKNKISTKQKVKKPLSIEEKKNDNKMRDLLLNNVNVTDFNSIYQKSLRIRETLKPQSLLNYKANSENTQMTK